jgi:hypothetical protein
MPDFLSLSFWRDQGELVMSAPWIIVPLLLIAGFIAWRVKGALDEGEVRAVRAQREGLQSRLDNARHEGEGQSLKISKIQTDVAELRRLIHLQAKPEELERIATTVESTANAVAITNEELNHILKAGPRANTGSLAAIQAALKRD